MDNLLEKGTEVLLFYKHNGDKNKITSFIKGNVIEVKQKEYSCMHGNPLIKTIYTIQDENNNIYKAVYGNTIQGYYIRTLEDHIEYIRDTIKENMNTINELYNYNNALENLMDSLIETNNKTK